MIKKSIKYLFLSAVVIFALFQPHDSHGVNHIDQKSSYRITKYSHDVIKSSNSQLSMNLSSINMILKELNFEELNFQKFKLLEKITTPSFIHFHQAALPVDSEKCKFLAYSFAKDAFNCWYILYQVFRI